MDSSLEGQYATGDASKLVEVASRCLQMEARDRPYVKFLLTAIAPFQKQTDLVLMMFVSFATIYVRRGLSYLMTGEPELALRDAKQAQVCMPEWRTAFYLYALALSKLGMEKDAQDMLNDGTVFEAKKQCNWHF